MDPSSIRIAVLQFCHETVSFLPNDTTLADFIYQGSPASGEALLATDPRGYMGGFVQVAREFAGVELVGIESPLWPKTGTGSGWITEEAFETLVGRMMHGLAAEGPFDGAYLCLHGAMAVRGVARPEAELARRVRAAIGPGKPIAGTFDPHGNEDEAFLRHADLAFCVKYFPHYDMHLQGERAARTLVRAIRGSYKPTSITAKLPILLPTVAMWTGVSPWMDLVQRALTWEAREPDTVVNIYFGFPWADVPDLGMTVQVIANDDPVLARRVADDMSEWIWRRRDALAATAQVHRITDGVALAKKAAAEGKRPVVLADHSDRSGSATWRLRALLEQDVSRALIATVADGNLVGSLLARGVQAGDPFDAEVGGQSGGRADPSAGRPVRIQGMVHAVVEQRGNWWIVVGFGDGCVIILSPFLAQIIEPSALESIGLDLAVFDVIALKSRVHFRRGFDDTGFASTILLVEPDEPFLGTVRLDALPYGAINPAAFFPYASNC